MTFTHLETMNPFATHSRKTQRVYKSPADANEPSPFQKEKNKPLDIDAEDEEAGTILMSLAQHANRIHTTYDEKPARSNSMSIRNLLGSESDASIISPHVSLSTESIYHENRRNSKKGFQICITPRRNSTLVDGHPIMEDRRTKSFRHPSNVRLPVNKPAKSKYKRSTAHIHISYRIHAHRTYLARP
ncbi:hypothetical protein INT47_005280, partial [Mucor saturninus]